MIVKYSSSGQIITFYSYKGGTGRSMALANVACLLAKETLDEKILMIDWDLEAPGLHEYFHGRFKSIQNGEINIFQNQLGLIDIFYEIRNRLENESFEDELPESFFDNLNIEKYLVDLDIPSLQLLLAGKYDDKYSTRVNAFDWKDFFDKFPYFILQFAEYLRKKFKFILIDSRTGYTDISGICTSLMPQKLVVVFTPNRQSLIGAIELTRRSIEYRKQSDDLRPLVVYPLASRIENAEDKLHREWRFGAEDESAGMGYQPLFESGLKEAYNLPNCDLTDYFDVVQIQYKPRYSYGEEIAVLSERTEDRLSIARSYENFTEWLINLENPWIKTKRTERFGTKWEPDLDKIEHTFDVFLCHNSMDKPAVKLIAEELQKSGIRPWLDEWELRPGLPWQEMVESQIGNIKSAAVFVGESGLGPWQEMEIRDLLSKFVESRSPVIPVILGNAPKKPKLPLFLREMTWVDFRKDDPDPMKRLIWGITGTKY